MSDYYEIRDRVPREEIDALTVAALRTWMERAGWKHDWTGEPRNGRVAYRVAYGYVRGPRTLYVVDGGVEPGQDMAGAVGFLAAEEGKRAHVVIAEIRAIADWQARCAAWVAPEGNCGNCWTCERELADPWEAPRPATFGPLCPTCGNKRCPRATDHRLECSGSNEPGQKGSRYT